MKKLAILFTAATVFAISSCNNQPAEAAADATAAVDTAAMAVTETVDSAAAAVTTTVDSAAAAVTSTAAAAGHEMKEAVNHGKK